MATRTARDLASVVSPEAALDRLADANRRAQDRVAQSLGIAGGEPLDLLFRAMIDQVPDYLFVKDLESRFVVANRAVAVDLGASPEEIIGKSDFDLHPPARAAQFFADERHVLTTGEPMIDIEEFVEMDDGSRRYLLTSKVPLRDADGRIIGLVGIARDVTARRRAEAEVQFLAHHDALTRLPNRRLLHDRLGQAILRAERNRRGVTVAFIDLDNFKVINDNFGHGVGDHVLKTVAKRMSSSVRASDTVARFGGDEFVIVLDDQDENAVRRAAVLEKVEAKVTEPIVAEGRSFEVGCSTGLATFPEDGSDATALLRCADQAMYAVKSRGSRNAARVSDVAGPDSSAA